MIKNRVTVIRGSKFHVHTDGIVYLLDKESGPLGRPLEIQKGAILTITGIDFYVNRVFAKWLDKEVLLTYEFIVRNIIPKGPILTSTVQALEVIEIMNEDKDVSTFTFNTVLVVLIAIACFVSCSVAAALLLNALG